MGNGQEESNYVFIIRLSHIVALGCSVIVTVISELSSSCQGSSSVISFHGVKCCFVFLYCFVVQDNKRKPSDKDLYVSVKPLWQYYFVFLFLSPVRKLLFRCQPLWNFFTCQDIWLYKFFIIVFYKWMFRKIISIFQDIIKRNIYSGHSSFL